MRNAGKMARYMMLRPSGNNRNDMRGGTQNEMRGEARGYMRGEARGEMRNEGGNYARDNYGVDNRFRDRRGREHYDNGRYAPRSEMGAAYSGPDGGVGMGQDSQPEYRAQNRGGTMTGNPIGFSLNSTEIPSNYSSRVEYHGGNEMENRSGEKMHGGASGVEGFNEDMAKKWTKGMKNADGSKGEHWSMEQIKALMNQRGVRKNAAEVYAIINSLYSDFCKVLNKYGFNSPEAYLDLAVAWLDDEDAVDDKAMAYYENIVKKQ